MVITTMIVVDTTTTMAPISAVDNNAVAPLVAKSNLAFGALAAPAAGGLTEPSVELLQRFTKETLADTVRLLAFDQTNSSPGVNA